MKRPTYPLLITVCAVLAGPAVQAQALNGTLALSNYNGSNISCKGAADGSIDLTPTGGTPPYTYEWSNNATTQDLSGLVAGYYSVRITDAASTVKVLQATLTEPTTISAYATLYEYGNGYNVSLFNAFNGSITVTRSGGKTPYTQVWNDANTQQNRTGVGAGNYSFTITDANGCIFNSATYQLTQPERTDWTMGGNSGTNPATQYIGTSDNKDVVFKSNGQERLRLLANGDVKIAGLADGWLKSNGGIIGGFDPYEDDQLMQQSAAPFWKTTGNMLLESQPNPPDRFLGTTDNTWLNIRTNNTYRMGVSSGGTFAIGTETLNSALGNSKVVINQGWGDWLTLVNNGDGGAWKFHSSGDEDGLLIYRVDDTGDGAGASLKLWNDGKISIGDVSTNTPDYEYGLYLWRGLLTERVKVALKTTNEWSDHVFEPNYALMPLEEVAQYIGLNGHLPGVPSAECMVEDGLDVVKTDALLLQKIEELTLHLIAVNERLAKLEAENARLRQPRIR